MKKIYLSVAIISWVCIGGCFFGKNNRIGENNRIETRPTYATDILSQEFDYIERMTGVLKNALECLNKGDDRVTRETFTEIVEVIRDFSDKRHQEKEDAVLFPFLKDVHGNENKDLLGQLLMEHVSLRDKIRDLSVSLNSMYLGKKAKKKITKIANAYINYTTKHIRMEKKKLFPWINEMLKSDEQAMLMKKFEDMKKAEVDSGMYEKYTIMIQSLEGQVWGCSNY